MATSGGDHERLLICRVGAKVCGLPLGRVIETMRPLHVEPLAKLAGFVVGLALIRGRPTPVIDARQLLGSPSQAGAGRYVTLGLDERNGQRVAALAVDEVLGIRAVEKTALSQLPQLLRGQQSQAVTAVGTLDAELLLVLEHAHWLPATLWQTLEHEAQPA